MADQDKLLNHDSDGIQEYDNDLPKWWVYLFVITIVWAGIYVGYFHFSGRPLPREEVEAEMKQLAAQAPQSAPSENLNWAALVQDSGQRAKGKEVFLAKCASCHTEDGGGLVGPNLTDNYWIHGGKPEQIFATINNGVPEKGMLAWKALLPRAELVAVTTHLIGLKGTHPKVSKAPQGNLEK